MGKKRSRVLNIVLGCILFVMFLILVTYPLTFAFMAFLWVVSNIVYGFYKKLNSNSEFRKLTMSEWNELKERNLIHYSHILDERTGKDIIHIPAHDSPKVNYRLPKKFRKEGFIWFHLSAENNDKEPTLQSFLSAHSFEGDPRNQKVIVKLNLIPCERMYIEKSTGFILVKGDLNIKADILEDFEWYNKKVYITFTVKETIKHLAILYYSTFTAIRAEFEEKQYNRKKEKMRTV